MFFNNDDLGKRNTSQEIKSFCLLTSCRRQFLSEHFGTEFDTCHPHSCCDNCHKACNCSQCADVVSDSLNIVFETCDDLHDINVDYSIQSALLQYFNAVNSSLQTVSGLDAALHTGLTQSLSKDIAANYEFLLDPEVLQKAYSYLSEEYIAVICQIMSSVVFLQNHTESDSQRNEL